jgi:predicted RecA/RadA family phage recombinase
MDNGATVECSPLALSDGDFVDVGLSFDIALVKAPNGQRRVRVFLCLEHVLQLLPCRQVAKVT